MDRAVTSQACRTVLLGVALALMAAWVMDTVFGRYVRPMVLPLYEELVLDDGVRVAVVSFTQGVAKPYVLRHNGREEIYIRVGSVSRLATREQQARLFESGGMLHAETLPVSGTNFSSLDRARLADYLVNIAGDAQFDLTDDFLRVVIPARLQKDRA